MADGGSDAGNADDPTPGVSYQRLVGVGAGFVGLVAVLALVGFVVPGARRMAGMAIVACIGLFAVLGLVLVYRAGQRVGE